MTVAVCYPDTYPVEETFQLLKIPWEWYVSGTEYDVVIARKADVPGYTGPLIDLTENDFFREICDLLNHGKEHLHEPRCEILIDQLRSELKEHTILVEIPPAPWDHPYMVALTHDVDVTSVRECRWSTVGYAAYQSVLQGNIVSGFHLITARLGLGNDPWVLFDRWKTLEGQLGVRSTFFFVPTPGEPGRSAHPYRAVPYSVEADILESLTCDGWEVGVHGIDNWTDTEKAKKERDSLGIPAPGNRTHWLLFDAGSWTVLDEAGYSYDTTFGYNDDTGFRAGTLQVYRPEQAKNLLELPLHIQDLGLFGAFCWAPSANGWEKTPCLHLPEKAARENCLSIFDLARKYGGVVTLLWHYENLTPPRDWSGLYQDLVSFAKADCAWVTTAGNIVEWFRIRREVRVTCHREHQTMTITPEGTICPDVLPPLKIRLHVSGNRQLNVDAEYIPGKEYIDIILNKKSITVSWV